LEEQITIGERDDDTHDEPARPGACRFPNAFDAVRVSSHGRKMPKKKPRGKHDLTLSQ
jgi:hypothetical protein